MKLFFWIIPCIFVLPQGVQAVVTHSLQAAMHSLGGIQVCNYNICFNTSDVMICWLKFSWNKILIWQHFHPVALRNFFCNLCSWWWSWKIFEVTETVWVPFILPRNSNIYGTDALLPWNARLLESWITGKVACVFSFCQLSQNISDDIFIWSVSWSMKNRSLVGYLILFRVSLKYFIVRTCNYVFDWIKSSKHSYCRCCSPCSRNWIAQYLDKINQNRKSGMFST